MDETIDINNTLPFEGGNPSPSIIKVIGVGGGGRQCRKPHVQNRNRGCYIRSL